MTKKNRKFPVTPPQAPLVTDMDALSYIRYHPGANFETLVRAFEEKEEEDQYFRAFRSARWEAFRYNQKLHTHYCNEEFLRTPWDWDLGIYPEERFPPEISAWKKELRKRFDGGQGLSEKKRRLVQSIVQPILEDAKFTFGRIEDFFGEMQPDVSTTMKVVLLQMHRDFLSRTEKAIENGLSGETDAPQYTKAAILSILIPVMREQGQLYQRLLEILGVNNDRSVSIN